MTDFQPALSLGGHQGSAPLYLQLARILRTQITAGEYKSRDLLPSEAALAKAFGVSRITVRGALRLLTDEGLIVRHSGKGTFVAERGEGGSLWAAVTVPDLISGGHGIGRRYLKQRVISASHSVSESLKLPSGARILEVEALMLLGPLPLAHVTLNVSEAMAKKIPKGRLVDKPLIYVLTQECDLQIAAVDQWTTASLADGRIADALEIQAGDPLLVIEQIFYDPAGRPIELAVNRYRTDRFRHHVRLQQGVHTEKRSILLKVASHAAEGPSA